MALDALPAIAALQHSYRACQARVAGQEFPYSASKRQWAAGCDRPVTTQRNQPPGSGPQNEPADQPADPGPGPQDEPADQPADPGPGPQDEPADRPGARPLGLSAPPHRAR